MTTPLLALKCPKAMSMDTFLSKIQWPQLATPKKDFIRGHTVENGRGTVDFLTRSMARIPNEHIADTIEKTCPPWVDGEVGAGDTFNFGQSSVMTIKGYPDFTWYVFDYATNEYCTYAQRVQLLQDWDAPAFVTKLIPVKLNCLKDLLNYEAQQLAAGEEGVMIRPPTSLYNTTYADNRSTFKKPYLVAIKRFEDGEARIVGKEELMHNTNNSSVNYLGRNKRAYNQKGLVPGGTLGAWIVRDLKTDIEFRIGSGMTNSQRQWYWDLPLAALKEKIVKYKWQKHGTKDKPRIPIFLGFRDVKDLF